MEKVEDIKLWTELESDPESMTSYLQLLTMSKYYLIDMPDIDEAASMGIFDNNNVVAYIFLFELNEYSQSDFVGILTENEDQVANVVFMRQTTENSCGTLALYHAFLNSCPQEDMDENSIMAKFFYESLDKTPIEKSAILEANMAVAGLHEKAARQIKSKEPSRPKKIRFRENRAARHYVALVWANGCILELDGLCDKMILHGRCKRAHFRISALGVIKKLIARDPTNSSYNVLALCTPRKRLS